MTSLIVALSTTDVTVRATVVGLLGLAAALIASARFDWSQIRRGAKRDPLVYLRVDRRQGSPENPPTIRHRAAAGGGLVGFVIVGGIAIAITVSVVVAALIGSVTDLLR